MRENSETGKARPPYKPGVVPTTLVLIGATLMGPAALSHLDNHKQNIARAEAQDVVSGCRDTVRCTLGKISLEYKRKFLGLRKVDSKLTGQTIMLDGKTFKVGFSEKHGSVLIDEDGTPFLATPDLGNTIESVNAVLRKKGETK